ncbi:MAG: 3-hydroxylacyl-ACP dehydratase [Gammaproteobacteria bacterium]|nr:3-hydroxylacyl-ACP dehydratase [Gammaproteobacteria bacterium]
MILVDQLLDYHAKGGRCRVTITPQSAFYDTDSKGVASYIGSEYMAQTIAAYAGALALDNDKQVKIGFLLGTRKYETFTPLFDLGDELEITVVELIQEESGLSVFDCIIKRAEQVVAQAKINVFQPDEPEQFLKENT